MDCSTCQSLVPQFALGQLTESQREQVALHLEQGCGPCREALRQAEEAWVLLARALPPAAAPPRVAAALRERIERTQRRAGAASLSATRLDQTPSGNHAPKASQGATVASAAIPARLSPGSDELSSADGPALSRRAIMIAAALLISVTLGFLGWAAHVRNRLDASRLEAQQRAAHEAQLQSVLQEAKEFFSGARLHFASLRETGAASDVRGYIVWDRLSRQIHFYAFDLPPLAADRVYRLWITRAGADPVPVGELTPRANGTESMVVDVPGEMGGTFGISVVEESAEAGPAPAGDAWLTTEVM